MGAAEIVAGHYFVGVVGTAMLRHWYLDGERNEVRMAELRRLLEQFDEFPSSLALNPLERDLTDGYAEWSESYDGENPLIDMEREVVGPTLQRLAVPGVRALDAACGTGRQAAVLHALGADVVGVDRSSEMLRVAKDKLPEVRFEQGDLRALPFDDGEFDLAVVSLALCHLDDPTDAVVELARVLRQDGALVVTDPHPFGAALGGQAFYGGIVPGRPMTWVRNHYHGAATWLRAFRLAGLDVVDCDEVPFSDAQIETSPGSFVVPEAMAAAMAGLPSLWVWQLAKRSSSPNPPSSPDPSSR